MTYEKLSPGSVGALLLMLDRTLYARCTADSESFLRQLKGSEVEKQVATLAREVLGNAATWAIYCQDLSDALALEVIGTCIRLRFEIAKDVAAKSGHENRTPILRGALDEAARRFHLIENGRGDPLHRYWKFEECPADSCRQARLALGVDPVAR